MIIKLLFNYICFRFYFFVSKVQLNISNDIDVINVKLFNVLGQQIAIATNNTIEMSFLPAGLYYLEIATNLGTITKTVIRK